MYYESEWKEMLEDTRRECYDLDRENKELKSKLTRMEEIEKMNQHLLEIHKNRSNALREIRPKKEHSGYVPKYQEMVYDRNVGDCWKTVVETPYSIEMTYDEVKTPVTEYAKRITGDERGFRTKVTFRRNFTTGFWNCSIIIRDFKDFDFEQEEDLFDPMELSF